MRVDQGTQITYQSLLGSKASGDDSELAWAFEPSEEDDGSSSVDTSDANDPAAAGVDATSISAGYWYRLETTKTTQTGDTNSNGSDGDTAVSSAVEAKETDDQSILDDFAKWSKMTFAERIRAQYLADHHLTEEQFQALPAEQQVQINKEIADEIKRQLGSPDEDVAALSNG